MKYIAYGMNTNSAALLARCPGAVSLGLVYLPNYKLTCRYHFDIDYCAGNQMQAVLWDIPNSTLPNLDILEGYPSYYTRIPIVAYRDVELTDPISAEVYIMTAESKLTKVTASHPGYFEMVKEGYIQHGLELSQIKDFEMKDSPPDLENDLLADPDISSKAKNSESYAQNLYAALCNTEWQKLELLPILRDQRWHCSWRSAGRILAELVERGDYMDWYCSGIRNVSYDEKDNARWDQRKFVAEGTVTDEIAADLKRLGWTCVHVSN